MDSVTLTVIDGDNSNICPNTSDCYLISCICCGESYCGAHTEHVCNEIIPIPPNITSCPNTSSCNVITCQTCGENYCTTHKTHNCKLIIDEIKFTEYYEERYTYDSERSQWIPEGNKSGDLLNPGDYEPTEYTGIRLDENTYQLFNSENRLVTHLRFNGTNWVANFNQNEETSSDPNDYRYYNVFRNNTSNVEGRYDAATQESMPIGSCDTFRWAIVTITKTHIEK